MSVKFDKCPICGRQVGYEDEFGDNKDLVVAMCLSGHTIADLGFGYGLARSNEFQAAKVWNRAARKYKQSHKEGL